MWCAIAQNNATIGRADFAVAALHRAEELIESLPEETWDAGDSLYGWTEYRLLHTQSFTYSQLGHTTDAYAAQDRALPLYPAGAEFVGRVQVELHRARCMVVDHDIRGGISHALDSLNELPPEFAAHAGARRVAGEVLAAVPCSERNRSDVRALAEVIR